MDEKLQALAAKVRPSRFPNMSGMMAAILGYLLDQEGWTDPEIDFMVVTSDGFVLAQHQGDVGANHFIGAYSDAFDNVEKLIEIPEVGLTDDEKLELRYRFKTRISRVGYQSASGH